jgi:hypothetical protein
MGLVLPSQRSVARPVGATKVGIPKDAMGTGAPTTARRSERHLTDGRNDGPGTRARP